MSTFGQLLREYRLAAGLSQEALAERARMSAGGVSVLERGARQAPYRDTVALLAEALSLSPIDRAQFEAAAERPSAPRRRGARECGNLRAEVTTFVGRSGELAGIATLLERGRLVTIVGPPGVGKTRTALHVALGLRGSADGGAWFVDLAPHANAPNCVALAILETLGMAEAPNRAPLGVLRSFLARKATLLILDNCEHVLAEAASDANALLEIHDAHVRAFRPGWPGMAHPEPMAEAARFAIDIAITPDQERALARLPRYH